jgi:hypothetical protein
MTMSNRSSSPPFRALRASKLMLTASFCAVKCTGAVELGDRRSALTCLADLRDALRELEQLDHPMSDELSKLRWQETKLAAAVLAKTDWPDAANEG